MGSFNTSCMVSQQTIVPHAHAVILPISQQATYNPVELIKGGKELSQYGFAHTSCLELISASNLPLSFSLTTAKDISWKTFQEWQHGLQ